MTRKQSILFVCIGNTCRSPMAEYIAKHIFNDDVFISSCGLKAVSSKVNPNTIKVIIDKLDIDITERKPKNINNVDLKEFDIIYSLDKEVSSYLNKSNISSGNIFELFIDDPYGQEIAKYYDTFNDIFLKLKAIEIDKASH